MSRAATRWADLHLHTIFSDGAYTPEELAALARARRLAVIALTDHDTLDGLDRTRKAAGDDGPEVVPGVEFSAPSRGDGSEEAHIVGLFLDPKCEDLQAALARFRKSRRERALRIVEKLNRAGIPLRADDVFDLAGVGNPGRLHIARALVQGGYAKSVEAAFRKWIRVDRPAYAPRERPPARDTIGLIHRAGGVAVLAHPGLTGVDQDIPALVGMGLDAIEVYCADHTPEQEQRYLGIAQRHGLLVSGGSDCHGHHKDRAHLGKVRLDLEAVEALRRRAGSAK